MPLLASMLEFKSTLRTNLHTGQKDPRIEMAVLKTIAAFLNTKGGTLIIGVSDTGDSIGIETDEFPSEDRMSLHLSNIVKERVGAQYMIYVDPRFEDYQGKRVLVVDCSESRSPVFVRDGTVERFYVRTGASTTELTGNEMQSYILKRFS